MKKAKTKDTPDDLTKRERYTIYLPTEVVESVRRAAYWNRESIAQIAERAITNEVAKMRRANGGEEFAPVPGGKLRRGRTVGGIRS